MAVKPKKKKARKKKVPLTPKEKLQKKKQVALHKNILELFRRLGFEYISTDGRKASFAGQEGEFDNVFLFENLIIICEETVGENNTSDHLKGKYIFYEKMLSKKDEFLKWIKTPSLGEEKFKKFEEYTNARYKFFHLYFTDTAVEEEKQETYNKFKYLDSKVARYFLKIADCIRFSARNEFYKFLGIESTQVGNPKASTNESIHSAVIFPEDVSGMPNGVHVVSFIMTAKELLDCAYVFRKENLTEDSGFYYQRLIEKKKIVSIRSFLVKEQRTFIDNIIVSLPKEAKFYTVGDEEEKALSLKELSEVTNNVEIKIPYKSNSIGIIDGQHRVFGHHEGPDKDETVISKLREKRHLFVTGLFYDKGKFTEAEKRKFESKLFLEINSKQKKVSTQLLQDVQSLQDPLSAIGISTSVIRKMNNRSPFVNHFILSELDKKGIKTPTIINYALNQLVEIDAKKETLFKYWPKAGKGKILTAKDQEADSLRIEYVTFCSDSICKFFTAVKETFDDDWIMDGSSKLMTVTSIVAFLKSYNYTLEFYGEIKEIKFYREKLSKLKDKIDFKDKKGFPYISSQWPKFAELINKCWTK
jgi:DGQHR domain-containing protein